MIKRLVVVGLCLLSLAACAGTSSSQPSTAGTTTTAVAHQVTALPAELQTRLVSDVQNVDSGDGLPTSTLSFNGVVVVRTVLTSSNNDVNFAADLCVPLVEDLKKAGVTNNVNIDSKDDSVLVVGSDGVCRPATS